MSFQKEKDFRLKPDTIGLMLAMIVCGWIYVLSLTEFLFMLLCLLVYVGVMDGFGRLARSANAIPVMFGAFLLCVAAGSIGVFAAPLLGALPGQGIMAGVFVACGLTVVIECSLRSNHANGYCQQ